MRSVSLCHPQTACVGVLILYLVILRFLFFFYVLLCFVLFSYVPCACDGIHTQSTQFLCVLHERGCVSSVLMLFCYILLVVCFCFDMSCALVIGLMEQCTRIFCVIHKLCVCVCINSIFVLFGYIM